jgi:predicted dehydrogenase
MVGGGEGAFIGQVHRMAAELDGMAQLVCGAFASDPERSKRSGINIYHLDAARCYADYAALLAGEAALPADERMQFVVIVTPNHMHFPVAQAALRAGFDVVCDKPVTLTLAEAHELQKLLQDSGRRFALTHNYTGYPMLREARTLVSSGQIGEIRRVSCEYLQGWLAEALDDNKQADWRTDPARAGVAGCFGDIGSHGENLIEYVTGLELASVCADLTAFVPGRALDDDGNVLLRFTSGARGVLSASQIAVGKENDLCIQVYGERGGLEWRQSEANSLVVRWPDKPYEVRRAGWPGTGEASLAATRIPPGHPEGYLEAFAEIYRNFCLDVRGEAHHGYPGIAAGVRGMRFIEAVVQSSAQGAVWTDLE